MKKLARFERQQVLKWSCLSIDQCAQHIREIALSQIIRLDEIVIVEAVSRAVDFTILR